jgi:hypothetical protein
LSEVGKRNKQAPRDGLRVPAFAKHKQHRANLGTDISQARCPTAFVVENLEMRDARGDLVNERVLRCRDRGGPGRDIGVQVGGKRLGQNGPRYR